MREMNRPSLAELGLCLVLLVWGCGPQRSPRDLAAGVCAVEGVVFKTFEEKETRNAGQLVAMAKHVQLSCTESDAEIVRICEDEVSRLATAGVSCRPLEVFSAAAFVLKQSDPNGRFLAAARAFRLAREGSTSTNRAVDALRKEYGDADPAMVAAMNFTAADQFDMSMRKTVADLDDVGNDLKRARKQSAAK